MSRIHRIPSPALVLAFIALLVALAGTASALPGKNTVDKNDVKKNAIAGKQVKNNSITGADVKESSLATVPSATSATSATTAATATKATDSDALGGKSAAQTISWAQVSDSSSQAPAVRAAGTPGFTVADPNGAPEGETRITAPFAVNKCSVQVSQTLISTVLGPDSISANPLVLAASVYDTSPTTINVSVVTRAGVAVDTGYSLAISC